MIFSLTISALMDQQGDNKNESAATFFLNKIGRIGAKRLELELLNDAKDKADAVKFDLMRILTQNYHTCKSKSKPLFEVSDNVCFNF